MGKLQNSILFAGLDLVEKGPKQVKAAYEKLGTPSTSEKQLGNAEATVKGHLKGKVRKHETTAVLAKAKARRLASDEVPSRVATREDPYKVMRTGDEFSQFTPQGVEADDTYDMVAYDIPQELKHKAVAQATDHRGDPAGMQTRRWEPNPDTLTVLELQSDLVNAAASSKQPAFTAGASVNWLSDLVNRQLKDGIDSAKSKVDFLVSPATASAGRLQRSQKVQTRYETTVAKTIQKRAKAAGLTTEFVTHTAPPHPLWTKDMVAWTPAEWLAKSRELRGALPMPLQLKLTRKTTPDAELVDPKWLDKLVTKPDFKQVASDLEAALAASTDKYLRVRLPAPTQKATVTLKQKQAVALLGKSTDKEDLRPLDGLESAAERSQLVQAAAESTGANPFTFAQFQLGPLLSAAKASPATSAIVEAMKSRLTKAAGIATGVAVTFPAFAETADEKLVRLPAQIKSLLDKGQPATAVRDALANSFPAEVVTRLMVQALQPKIEALRAKGVAEEQLLAAFQAKGLLGPDATIDALNSQDTGPTDGPQSLQNPEMAKPTPEQTQDPKQEMPTPVGAPVVGSPSVDPMAQADTPERADLVLNGTSAARVIEQIQAVRSRYSDLWTGAKAFTGVSPKAKLELRQLRAETNKLVEAELKQFGFSVDHITPAGEVFLIDPETGEAKEVNETSLFNMVADSAYEVTSALGGAYLGAQLGARGYLLGPVPGTLGTLGGMAAGAGAVLLTSAFGAGLGRSMDVLRHANDLHYEVTLTETMDAMYDAGVAEVTLGLLGTSIKGLFDVGVSGTRKIGKGLARGWDQFVVGNKHGALKTLMEVYDLNDVQAIEIVTKWENLTGNSVLSDTAKKTGKLVTSDADGLLRVVGETRLKGDAIVEAAKDESISGGAKLSTQIDTRAKDIIKEAEALTNDNVALAVQDTLGATSTPGLNSYITQTKDAFAATKDLGLDLMADTNYTFDFKSVAIVPAMQSAKEGITNGMLRKDFLLHLEKIQAIGKPKVKANTVGKAAKGPKILGPDGAPVPSSAMAAARAPEEQPYRAFADLIDLRKALNELRGDSRFADFNTSVQMKTTLKQVDAEITRAAKQHMPEGNAWVKQWKSVNTEYHNMKQLEKNVLFKTLTNPRLTPDRAVKAITQSMMYQDPSTFMQVMSKLSQATRVNVEGAVTKHLVEKHTIGFEGGKQAINLPQLAIDLDKIALTQPAARELKRTVKQFADVFQNDGHLLAVTGSIPLPKFQSYLTVDPVMRAKFALATAAFNGLRARVPFSKMAGRAAMVKHLGAILDNPLHVKSVKEVRRLLPNDPELTTALHKLALEFTAKGKPENYGKVPIYRVYKPGEFNKRGSTPAGRGVLYYTDKGLAAKIAKQTGAKMKEVQQLYKRIATPEDISKVLGRPMTKEDLKRDEVLNALELSGLDGVAFENKVVRFK